MEELLAHDSYLPRTYLPFALPGGDSAWGCRFGGKPPEGVLPPFEPFLYVMTLQYSIEPHVEFSIFLNFSASHKDEHFDILSQNKHQMFDAASPEGQDLLYVAVHGPTGRDIDSEAPYLLPTSSIEYGDAGIDEVDDQFTVYRHHKVGGLPKFHYFRPSLADPSFSLLSSGCTHLLQLSPPGSGDFVQAPTPGGTSGWPDMPWPFGDFIFHLFMRTVNGRYVFYFGWG